MCRGVMNLLVAHILITIPSLKKKKKCRVHDLRFSGTGCPCITLALTYLLSSVFPPFCFLCKVWERLNWSWQRMIMFYCGSKEWHKVVSHWVAFVGDELTCQNCKKMGTFFIAVSLNLKCFKTKWIVSVLFAASCCFFGNNKRIQPIFVDDSENCVKPY